MLAFLAINKPSGPTSHDTIDQLRRSLGTRQIGHTGTLDPLASGILIMCIGKATRLASFVESQEKEYLTTIRLGATSDTYDVTGSISEQQIAENAHPSRAEIEKAIRKFTGTIQQTPPAFSAIHINGKRAHELARAGEKFTIAPRTVTIRDIKILQYEWPRLSVQITCSKGTYIRSLAHDIGVELGCGGIMETLQRTRVGAISLAHATQPENLNSQNLAQHALPLDLVFPYFPQIMISDKDIIDIRHGKAISAAPQQSQHVLLLDNNTHQLIALATVDHEKNQLQPIKVF